MGIALEDEGCFKPPNGLHGENRYPASATGHSSSTHSCFLGSRTGSSFRRMLLGGSLPYSIRIRPSWAVSERHSSGTASKTEAFRSAYGLRAGVEATHGQANPRCGLRHCRYLGAAKTHLQHVATAAVNLVRVWDWVSERSPAATRVTRFARLAPA